MPSTLGSNLGIYHSWSLGESGWNVQSDSNLKLLDATVFLSFVSATTSAEPGSPAAGDRYLIPASATGANWAGRDGDLAAFDGTNWAFFVPKEGWRGLAEDTGQPWLFTSSSWALQGSTYAQHANDAAAGVGGVPIGGFYVNSTTGALQVRLT